MHIKIIVMLVLFLSIFTFGCTGNNSRFDDTGNITENESARNITEKEYCQIDSDCICEGKDSATNNCFIGSRQYYDKYVIKNFTCPDFCTGFAGNLVTKCVDNKCRLLDSKQISACNQDADCVRQWSCCDCDAGTYVNKKYLETVSCKYTCACESAKSTGKCVNNTCVAVITE